MHAPATHAASEASTLHGSERGTSRTPTPIRRLTRFQRRIRRGAASVHAALDTQRSTEQPPAAASHADAFLQWAQGAGIVVPKLRPADFDGGRSHPRCWCMARAHNAAPVEWVTDVWRTPAAPVGVPAASWYSNITASTAPAGVRGMQATAPIAAAETLVTLPRAAALLLTPKMRCPFPDTVDATYWDGSPWCGGMRTLAFLPSVKATALRREVQPPDRVSVSAVSCAQQHDHRAATAAPSGSLTHRVSDDRVRHHGRIPSAAGVSGRFPSLQGGAAGADAAARAASGRRVADGRIRAAAAAELQHAAPLVAGAAGAAAVPSPAGRGAACMSVHRQAAGQR